MDASIASRSIPVRPLLLVVVCACAGVMALTFAGHARRGDANASASPAAIPTLIQFESAIDRGGRLVMMEVTAYCPCTRCCGPNAQGITASGKTVDYAGGRFVAADTSLLPFGTLVSISGYHDGQPVEVIDRGGAIKGNRLDVYFDSHDVARVWGRQTIPVIVYD
jgi:3D (Asp-Asp-Asp) domain-containing protein